MLKWLQLFQKWDLSRKVDFTEVYVLTSPSGFTYLKTNAKDEANASKKNYWQIARWRTKSRVTKCRVCINIILLTPTSNSIPPSQTTAPLCCLRRLPNHLVSHWSINWDRNQHEYNNSWVKVNLLPHVGFLKQCFLAYVSHPFAIYILYNQLFHRDHLFASSWVRIQLHLIINT